MPPADIVPDTGSVDPHVLKAIAKAWSWRRKLESGAVSTLSDIAEAEGVTPAFIRRTMKLAYLAPAVLERLLVQRVPIEASIREMTATAALPWQQQEAAVLGENL